MSPLSFQVALGSVNICGSMFTDGTSTASDGGSIIRPIGMKRRASATPYNARNSSSTVDAAAIVLQYSACGASSEIAGVPFTPCP